MPFPAYDRIKTVEFFPKTAIMCGFLRRVSPHGKSEHRVRGGSQQPTPMRQCRGFGPPPYLKRRSFDVPAFSYRTDAV